MSTYPTDPNAVRASLRAQPSRRFVSYLRVSTARQGASGLGLEAQREAILRHIAHAGPDALHLAEFLEVESGREANRPKLEAAIREAQDTNATLVIAKLDRLSRDAHFLLGLQKAGIEFVACDIPQANRLTIGVLAAVAEHEREMISERTKAALAAKRVLLAREGKRLGNPNGARCLKGLGNASAVAAVSAGADASALKLQRRLREIDPDGTMSARKLAAALSDRHIMTPRGGRWTAQGVIRLRARLAGLTV